MFTAVHTKINVIVGPFEAAIRYASDRRWTRDEFEIVTDADTLHAMDPPAIQAVVLLPQARESIGTTALQRLRYEIDDLRRLWHVRVENALAPPRPKAVCP